MWYTTFNKNVRSPDFFLHRIIRIVPLYWLVTTFYVAILVVEPSWLQSSKLQISHVIASYLFIPATHPVVTQFMWPLVPAGWTLNYEMFFYLLFGLALLCPRHLRQLVVVTMLMGVVALQLSGPPANSIIGFYSSSIMLEFALGVSLGYLFTTGISFRGPSSAFMLFAGLIGLVVGTLPSLAELPRLVTVGIPACLFVAGAVFLERSHNVSEIAVPKLLGDASYSIYLSHGAVLSAFEQFWRATRLPYMLEPAFAFIFLIVSLIVATITGVALYYFAERPLLNKFHSAMKWMGHK